MDTACTWLALPMSYRSAFSGYSFTCFEPSIENRVHMPETAGTLRLPGRHGNPKPFPTEELGWLPPAPLGGAETETHTSAEFESQSGSGLASRTVCSGEWSRLFTDMRLRSM